MTERDREVASIEVLHRMISYIREEARRLRVMDVVLLLEHAEEAVTVFAPAAAGKRGRPPEAQGAGRVEH